MTQSQATQASRRDAWSKETDSRIADLCTYLESYLEPDQIKEIYRAYLFGAQFHSGQT
ncbi:MAG: hypothetical protein GY753_08415, partial [Gammaproteobacteria bacterium]|nr:hypothetical protein [Gammaproteobacteria bacterium]